MTGRDELHAAAAALNTNQRGALARYSRKIASMTDDAIGRDQHFDWLRQGTRKLCTVCMRPGESHNIREVGQCMREWISYVLTNPPASAQPAARPETKPAVPAAERTAAAAESAKAHMWDAIHKAEAEVKTRRASNPYRVTDHPQPKKAGKLDPYTVTVEEDK